jgi:hypothetical protein
VLQSSIVGRISLRLSARSRSQMVKYRHLSIYRRDTLILDYSPDKLEHKLLLSQSTVGGRLDPWMEEVDPIEIGRPSQTSRP